jgi:hypothetical protein
MASASSSSSTPSRTIRSHPILLGRDRQPDALHALVEGAAGGRGHTVLVALSRRVIAVGHASSPAFVAGSNVYHIAVQSRVTRMAVRQLPYCFVSGRSSSNV